MTWIDSASPFEEPGVADTEAPLSAVPFRPSASAARTEVVGWLRERRGDRR